MKKTLEKVEARKRQADRGGSYEGHLREVRAQLAAGGEEARRKLAEEHYVERKARREAGGR